MDAVIYPILYKKEVTLLAASPYAGKSRLCLRLAYQLATGEETIFGKFPPIRVLYCSERRWDFTTTQFATHGYKEIPENLDFFCVPDIPKKDRLLFKLKPLQYVYDKMFTDDIVYDVIILDTMVDFVSAEAKTKTSDYGTVRTSILDVQQWAIEHNITILALHHSPKSNEKTHYKNPIEKAFGSISFVASTAAVLIIEPTDPERREYIEMYQDSHLAKMDAVYRYFATADYREVTKEETAAPRNKPTALTNRDADILELIDFDWASYPDTLQEIHTKLKISPDNIRNYLKRLIDKGQIAIDHAADGKLIKRFHPN